MERQEREEAQGPLGETPAPFRSSVRCCAHSGLCCLSAARCAWQGCKYTTAKSRAEPAASSSPRALPSNGLRATCNCASPTNDVLFLEPTHSAFFAPHPPLFVKAIHACNKKHDVITKLALGKPVRIILLANAGAAPLPQAIRFF